MTEIDVLPACFGPRSPARILLVDDELSAMETLQGFLHASTWPFEILRANHGLLALEIARQEPLDLLISDWDMPHMNGLSLLQHLKQDPTLADLPVIICTGIMTRSYDLSRALGLGAVDFVRKPVDELEFLARVRNSLLLSSRESELKRFNQAKDQMFLALMREWNEGLGQMDLRLENLQTAWPEIPALPEKYLIEARSAAQRGQTHLQQLLKQAHYRFMPLPALQQVLVREILEEIQAQYMEPCSARQIELRLRCNSEHAVLAESQLLRDLLNAWMRFSLSSLSVGCTLALRLHQEGRHSVLSLEDNGPGFAAEALDALRQDLHLHDGADLRISDEIARLLRAKLEIQSKVGQGTKLSLRLESLKKLMVGLPPAV